MNKGAYGIHAPGGVRETGYIPLSDATVLTLVHDLGRPPDIVNVVFLCTAADNGWIPGEVAVAGCNNPANSVNNICAVSTRTTVKTHNLSTSSLYLPLKTSGASFFVVFASWKVKLRAIWIAPV
jgi:hypothetical protein